MRAKLVPEGGLIIVYPDNPEESFILRLFCRSYLKKDGRLSANPVYQLSSCDEHNHITSVTFDFHTDFNRDDKEVEKC